MAGKDELIKLRCKRKVYLRNISERINGERDLLEIIETFSPENKDQKLRLIVSKTVYLKKQLL